MDIGVNWCKVSLQARTVQILYRAPFSLTIDIDDPILT